MYWVVLCLGRSVKVSSGGGPPDSNTFIQVRLDGFAVDRRVDSHGMTHFSASQSPLLSGVG